MVQKQALKDGLPEVFCTVTDQEGKIHTIRRNSRQHDTLTVEQLQRIGQLRAILKDAYPMTLDGWVDGFLRERYPEREISIIECIAVVYQELTSNTKLSLDEKKHLYGFLCSMSAGARLKK
jgi:hypothetical protein